MKDDACTNEQSEQQESKRSHTLVTHTLPSFPINTTTTATTTTATTTTADAHRLPNWKVQSAREKALKIYEQQIGTERKQTSGSIAPVEKAKSLISKLPFGKKDRFVFFFVIILLCFFPSSKKKLTSLLSTFLPIFVLFS